MKLIVSFTCMILVSVSSMASNISSHHENKPVAFNAHHVYASNVLVANFALINSYPNKNHHILIQQLETRNIVTQEVTFFKRKYEKWYV
jgi:hypothetical protein